jgi:hypothetical protein
MWKGRSKWQPWIVASPPVMRSESSVLPPKRTLPRYTLPSCEPSGPDPIELDAAQLAVDERERREIGRELDAQVLEDHLAARDGAHLERPEITRVARPDRVRRASWRARRRPFAVCGSTARPSTK